MNTNSPPPNLFSQDQEQDQELQFNQNFYNRNYYNFNKANNPTNNPTSLGSNFQKPFKKYNNSNYRPSQSSVPLEPQHVEFNLNNGAFPPISVNKNNCKLLLFFIKLVSIQSLSFRRTLTN